MRGGLAVARDLSYTRGQHGIEVKHYWPQSRREAIALVKAIFAKQGSDGWDERSQFVYMRNKGVEPKRVEELTVEELRVLITAMDKAHMVIFFDRPNQEE